MLTGFSRGIMLSVVDVSGGQQRSFAYKRIAIVISHNLSNVFRALRPLALDKGFTAQKFLANYKRRLEALVVDSRILHK